MAKEGNYIISFTVTDTMSQDFDLISLFFIWHHITHAGLVSLSLSLSLSLSQCLVLGAGPCGLRTAIELALLGAQVVVLEKRESFSRNNVLHLWPYTISDLRGLGAKKFYGKFCTGSLDHISE